MAEALKGMGMPTAFSPGNADFSGMDGTRELYISDVIHQAFVEVNEKGTEAAAATAVIMVATMALQSGELPPVFRADHPFIFIIQERESGNILFLGKVADPTK
jgi:serpin B